MNTECLIENIIEQIKEIQLKLGFVKEVIRLYYPIESLCRLLGVKCESGEELLDILEQEESLKNTSLGMIRFALSRERMEVCIPVEGAVYVQEQIPDPAFLAGLIRLFQERHDLGIEELCKYFSKEGEKFVCERMEPGEEFDYVLYFTDGKPDAWFYCIRMEMGHTIYHRFSKKDWMSLRD